MQQETTTQKLSPTAKKYLAIIETGKIEERQLIAMKLGFHLAYCMGVLAGNIGEIYPTSK